MTALLHPVAMPGPRLALALLAALGLTALCAWAADHPPAGDDGNQIDCAIQSRDTELIDDDDERDNPPKVLRGDADGDGALSFEDVDCFIAALFGEELWRLCTGSPDLDFLAINDINRDGVVDFHDIEAFIDLILGHAPH